MMKTLVFLLALPMALALMAEPGDRASFGPLSPSAVPYERQYVWPEGRMPNPQAHQVAAKAYCGRAPVFKADLWCRP